MPAPEPVKALIALGSNMGNSRLILQEAFERLQELSARPIVRSSLWRSAPVDCPPGSPDFLNAAAAIFPVPNRTPEQLLGELKSIETAYGRKPKEVMNEPRPLDLDLIAFGDEVRTSASLTLPHPRTCERSFVLLPLSEIVPELILPGQTFPISQLVARFAKLQRVTRV